VLITAIGVSLFIEFTGQHKGVRRLTKPSPTAGRKHRALGRISCTATNIVVSLLTVPCSPASFVVQRTRTGMAMRAVSFNEQAAALMGVNINRIISFTFASARPSPPPAASFTPCYAGHRSAHGREAGPQRLRRRGHRRHRQSARRRPRRLLLGLVETFAAAFPASRTTATASPSPS
jgi:hypothetical protein